MALYTSFTTNLSINLFKMNRTNLSHSQRTSLRIFWSYLRDNLAGHFVGADFAFHLMDLQGEFANNSPTFLLCDQICKFLKCKFEA